jgi:hypothetical protein
MPTQMSKNTYFMDNSVLIRVLISIVATNQNNNVTSKAFNNNYNESLSNDMNQVNSGFNVTNPFSNLNNVITP